MKSKNQARREKRKRQRQASQPATEGSAEAALVESPVQPANEAPPVPASAAAATPSEAAAASPLHETSARREPRSSVTMLARRYDWVTESSPLFAMYQQVSARFKRARPHDEPADSADMGIDESDEGEETPAPVSKKQRRQEAKPQLADLKRRTRRPELVEWFDADARDPDFLVFLKTLPHAVQVPSNWRNRTDSPNFAPQPAYELPQNVADTGIMEMRDPNAENNTKPGRLDVDYEKMHSAFFEHESAPPLTSYGQVRDPKLRTLAFKPKRGPATSQFVPGSMSARLREALGLKPDDEAPWAEAMRKHGPPPGYRDQEPAHLPLWGTSL